MKEKNKKTLIVTTILCLLPVILAIIFYDKMPDQVAIHFNDKGKPDNYAPKVLAVFGLPLVFAAINIVVHIAVNNDPKRKFDGEFMVAFSKWFVPILSCIVNPITVMYAIGIDIGVNNILPVLCGAIFIIMGNYMPKCRQNYTIGIKVPWTLSDVDNWNKTHRFAGVLWIISGIIILVTGFASFGSLPVVMIIIFSAAILPIIYSYIIYASKNK